MLKQVGSSFGFISGSLFSSSQIQEFEQVSWLSCKDEWKSELAQWGVQIYLVYLTVLYRSMANSRGL